MQSSHVHLVSVGSATRSIAGSTPGSIVRLNNNKIKLELSGWLGDWIWNRAGAKLNVT